MRAPAGTARQRGVIPGLWFLALLCAGGCSHPLADRAAQYSTLEQRTTAALKPLSPLTHGACLRTARTEFLQQRLLRLQGESLNQPLDAKYYLDEVHWLDKAQATSGILTWTAYCAEMDRSAAAFSAGLAALSSYAVALGALADSGRDYHPDWGALLASVDSVQSGLFNPEERWTKMIPPMTTPVKELASLWISKKAEASLVSILVQAQPIVQRLIGALDRYLDAVNEQLRTLTARQATLIQSLETVSGFSAKSESVRAVKCGATPSGAPGSPESEALLTRLCEQSALQQKQIDALVLLALHENAQSLTTATADDLAIVGQFKATLAALGAVQTRLSAAAQASDDSTLERVSEELSRLSQMLEQLETAAQERMGRSWTSSKP